MRPRRKVRGPEQAEFLSVYLASLKIRSRSITLRWGGVEIYAKGLARCSLAPLALRIYLVRAGQMATCAAWKKAPAPSNPVRLTVDGSEVVGC